MHQIWHRVIISPVPGCMFLEQVGWGTWLSNKTFKLKRFGSKMSSRAKSFHTSCLRKVWLKASWLFVIYFFAKTDPVWIISSQYRSAWVFLSGAQSSLRKSIVFRICQHRTNYTGGHNGQNVIFWNQQSFHHNTQSSSERHDNCWSVVEADMRFVKKFTWPDFWAKNFTH